MVGEDDEFSHEGGEGEFFRFATSKETEVKRSKDSERFGARPETASANSTAATAFLNSQGRML